MLDVISCLPHSQWCNSSERIHKEPGGEEHADGQQDHSEVREHSRVHRAGVSGHGLEFLQRYGDRGSDGAEKHTTCYKN